jgi:predicted ATPase/class 3 adenylate cyclase
MRNDLPTGTVTFLFTDVEGSTKLLHSLGAEEYAKALAEHRRVIRQACAAEGVEVDTQGDAFFFAFPTAPGALAAAVALTESLAPGPIHVRVGLHTGTPLVTDEGYIGDDVHRTARIAAVGHGGQVLVSASTASLVDTELTDLGEHRFKDLAAPEHVYQLGKRAFPSLKSLLRTNLPVPATPFLGREHELAEVVDFLARHDVPLLTLTGPGGTGKTRLAVQAAAEAFEHYPDGVWWVPLAPLHDPSLVLSAVAQSLELAEVAGLELRDRLSAELEGKRALFLLDNAEHLLPDAAREIAALAAIQGPLLLLTSRERLQLQGEQVYPVPTLVESDGVELFLARARALEPAFEANGAVSELCARLDHLPLALELAAARTVVFSPEQLLERLSHRLDLLRGGRDADPRQQTLRATIEWSYDLLEKEEQRLFRALAVFAGGSVYEAAEAICGADPDTLQSLIDKSLVRRRDTGFGFRYWMLETIREYAAEGLEVNGESFKLRRRHAEWCDALAERLVGIGPEPRHTDDFGAFPDEYGNVRSALGWAWSQNEDELALRLGAKCWRYWMGRGQFQDAVHWFELALPKIPEAHPPTRLLALRTSGAIAFFVLNDTQQAEDLWRRALADAQELDAQADTAWIEANLASCAWERGDLEVALEMTERLLATARESADDLLEARAQHHLGELLRDLGRFEEAEVALLEADRIYRELGHASALSGNTHSLADLALDRGDLWAAITLYRESLDAELPAGRQRDAAYCLAGLASVLAELGREIEAATIWGCVCAVEDALGFRMLGAERRRYEKRLARLERSSSWAEGQELTLEGAYQQVVAALE